MKRSNEVLWQCILVEVYESNMFGIRNSMNNRKIAYAKRLYKKRGGKYIMQEINVALLEPST